MQHKNKWGYDRVLSPTEQYKINILSLMGKCQSYDMEQNKLAYVSSVKHLNWAMTKYLPKTIRERIRELDSEMEQKIKQVDNGDLTSEQKTRKKNNLKYEYYNRIGEITIKMVAFSPIVTEEATGVLKLPENSMEGIKKYNKKIRNEDKKHIEVVDYPTMKGDKEDGIE